MAFKKLILENFEDDVFYICAIHSHISFYKMAFLLNKHLNLKFKRHIRDVKINQKSIDQHYPCYVYKDTKAYSYYILFKNKYNVDNYSEVNNVTDSLFKNNKNETLTKNLIPEFKKVDYFLKIETDNQLFDIKKIVSKIKLINQVITAFAIDYKQIKTKNNLIIT